jgi:hypothetical protein
MTQIRLFKKEVPSSFTAIKLYCLSEPNNRDLLISTILKSIEHTFNSLPIEYDIHGPYGIRKGATVGIQEFQSKLSKKGHDKYHGVWAQTNGKFGFYLQLGALLGRANSSSYSELIIWYAPKSYSINFLKLVMPILEPFNAACGFDIEIPASHDIFTETKIKRGFFGTSIEVNNKHLSWISSIPEGAIRGIYKNNIVNSQQLAKLSSSGITASELLPNGLHYFSFPNNG